MICEDTHAPTRVRWSRVAVAATASLVSALVSGCADDGPLRSTLIEVDVYGEARTHNGGALYEFVADETGYVEAPEELPTGHVMLTLTYTGTAPAPHSLIIEGLNGDQPIVAVDLPGSNNGTVVIPPGAHVFYDGAPGNRAAGFEGRLHATPAPGDQSSAPPTQASATVTWSTSGLEFVSAPTAAPADIAIALQLMVDDRLPHSIALERVRDEQPLVAVDGPGTNQRTITLPPGVYTFFCAVPGHRQAGMEGELHVG